MTPKIVSQRLKTAIDRLGISLKDVSGRAGIPYRTLQNSLSGTQLPSADTLGRLGTTFGISADWVLTGREIAQTATPAAYDEDLLAWTIAGVLSWMDHERAETPPTPTSQLVIGTYRVVAATTPRPDTPDKVAAQVKGILDGFRHLIR